MSRRNSSWSIVGPAVCVLPWLLACAPSVPPPARLDALPQASLSLADLVARVNADAAAVTALQGKLDLGMRVPPERAFKRCRGVLASRTVWGEPDSPGLFLEGYRQLIPTLFTLVSDGRAFWLHIPHDNTAYTGPLDGPHPVREGREIALDVLDLFRALFVAPLGTQDSLGLVEAGPEYVLSASRGGQLQRRLWIERRGWTVPREAYYDQRGAVRLDIERTAYADIGGRPYPMRIALRDGTTGGTVLLEFATLTLDPKRLDARIFQPKLPPGTVVRRTEAREASR